MFKMKFNKKLNRSLGGLNYMKIWHDNSGKGDFASWFLKFIIVHDLQTRERFYFICKNWLAVEKNDGKIEREMFIACQRQKTEINYLMGKHVKHHLKDYHMWYSVFSPPVQSSFTRFDRVTCCFVLLYISMVMNILYYGTVNETKYQHVINLVLFTITFEQVDIFDSLQLNIF